MSDETVSIAGHTRRAHFSCEEGDECLDDCLDGHVCDQCTDAEGPPAWWPCPIVEARQ
jgi:hypothetical protein